MFNIKKAGFGIAVAVSVLGSIIVATPANAATATETVVPVATPAGPTTAQGSVEFSSVDVSTAKGATNSKIYLKAITASGYKKTAPKSVSLTCTYKLTKAKYTSMKAKLKKLTASYNHKVAVAKKAHKKYKGKLPSAKFTTGCIAQDRGKYADSSKIQTYTQHYGVQRAGNTQRPTVYVVYKNGKLVRSDCNNEILPVSSKDKLTEVNITWTSNVKFTSTATATSSQKFDTLYHLYAASPDKSCIIDIYVHITVTATAEATATASASVKAEAESKSKGGITAASVKEKLSSSATAKTATAVEAKVEAAGTCSYTPPVTPPTTPQAPSVNVQQVNDVHVGLSRPVSVTYTVPGTDSATVSVTSRFGTITGSSSPYTYTAPTEVPSGGTDTITVTVKDTTTGLTATDSTTFTIKPADVPIP